LLVVSYVNLITLAEGGREMRGQQNAPLKVMWRREGRIKGGGPWRKYTPKVRLVRERGRERRGWLKLSPNMRWVREGGREFTEWLNAFPKKSSLRERGRWFTG